MRVVPGKLSLPNCEQASCPGRLIQGNLAGASRSRVSCFGRVVLGELELGQVDPQHQFSCRHLPQQLAVAQEGHTVRSSLGLRSSISDRG